MQIGRTILPPSAMITNFLRETLKEDSSLHIFWVPREHSLARTTGSGRVIGYPEVGRNRCSGKFAASFARKTAFWETNVRAAPESVDFLVQPGHTGYTTYRLHR